LHLVLQVNGWGFKRITEGPDLNAYYHEMFLRGLPQVAAKMRRPLKGQIDPSKELGQCPDFHKISMLAPLPLENAASMAKRDLKDGTGRSSEKKADVKNRKDSGPYDSVETNEPPTTEDCADFVDGKSLDDTVSVASGVASIKGYMVQSSDVPVDTPKRGADTVKNGAPAEYGVFGSSASVGSWHDRHEQDFAWGAMSASSSSAGSPHAHSAPLFAPDGYRMQQQQGMHISNTYSQVTPPTHVRNTPSNRASFPRNPSLTNILYQEETDKSGLSLADLAYLTNQNRILLSQAHKHHQK
jgi:hypothetical protein